MIANDQANVWKCSFSLELVPFGNGVGSSRLGSPFSLIIDLNLLRIVWEAFKILYHIKRSLRHSASG